LKRTIALPLRAVGVARNLTTDAHLAAIAIEHQYELHSNDTDFARFPGLRWRNPLSERCGQPAQAARGKRVWAAL
jgi:predicted nucleic acid-binding protein